MKALTSQETKVISGGFGTAEMALVLAAASLLWHVQQSVNISFLRNLCDEMVLLHVYVDAQLASLPFYQEVSKLSPAEATERSPIFSNFLD